MKITKLSDTINTPISAHKLQGLSCENIYVGTRNSKGNWPYVVFSRVRTTRHLFLLGNINATRKTTTWIESPDFLVLYCMNYPSIPSQKTIIDESVAMAELARITPHRGIPRSPVSSRSETTHPLAGESTDQSETQTIQRRVSLDCICVVCAAAQIELVDGILPGVYIYGLVRNGNDDCGIELHFTTKNTLINISNLSHIIQNISVVFVFIHQHMQNNHGESRKILSYTCYIPFVRNGMSFLIHSIFFSRCIFDILPRGPTSKPCMLFRFSFV